MKDISKIITNDTLSNKAKIIMIYFLSLNEKEFDMHREDICKAINMSTKPVWLGLIELEEKGFIHVNRRKLGRNNLYTILEGVDYAE